MKPFDVAVVGTSAGGVEAAAGIARRGLSVALVASATPDEENRERFWQAIASPSTPPAQIQSAFETRRAELENAGIEILPAPARFLSQKEMESAGNRLIARRWVLAPGSAPLLSDPEALTPWQCVASDPVPDAVTIVGGGPTAVALAFYLLGKKIHVTMTTKEKVLPCEDVAVQEAAENALNAAGAARQEGVHAIQENGKINFIGPDGAIRMEGRLVLAVGDRPMIDGLDLDRVGLYRTKEGWIKTMEDMRTSVPTFWAVGTVTNPRTPWALESAQAEIVAHNTKAPFWNLQRLDPDPSPVALPGPIGYARVGEPEAAVRTHHRRVTVTDMRDTVEGVPARLKLLTKRSGEILAAHAWGRGATAWVEFFDLAQRAGIPVSDLADRARFPRFTNADLLYRAINAAMSASPS